MPTLGEVAEGVATIVVVVATHLRAGQHRNRIGAANTRRLRLMAVQVAQLTRRVAKLENRR